jgi:hypothetical protein
VSLLSRSSVAAVAGAMLVTVAGCGSGGLAGDETNESPPPPNAGLAGIDPCTVLSQDDLTAFGLKGPGSPEKGISSEPGCYFDGENIATILYKNQEKTVDAYGKQGNWAQFNKVDVSGRSGASAIDRSATQARICSTLFDAGGGAIIIDVTDRPGNLDECAESLKIAQAIAPRLPK